MVDPAGPVLPVIPLVVRLRAQLKVLGVHAQAVMAAMSHHPLPSDDLSLQNAVDESVGVDLAPPEDHLARRLRGGHQTPLVGGPGVGKEGGDRRKLSDDRCEPKADR